MKRLIITEEEKNRIIDLHRLKEQSSPIPYQWSSPTPGDYVKVGFDKEEYKGDYVRKTQNISFESLLDNFVDIVASLLDGIPGIGNLASSGVDIAHSLSFFVRAYMTDDEKKQFENIINGILTGFMATIPFAGNVVNMGIRGTIKKFLDMTHGDVAKWLKQNGIKIRGGRIFIKSKTRFAFAYMAALISWTKGEIIDQLVSIDEYAITVENKLKILIDKLNKVKDLPFVTKFIEAIKLIISIFTELRGIIKLVDIEPEGNW